MTYSLFSLMWALVAWVALALLMKRHRALRPLAMGAQPERWPSLVVIIPARNEEANIETCLQDLIKQTYPGRFSIRVVDDGSSDRTGEIVAELARDHPKIELINAGPLPGGWLGKPHACWVGSSGVQDDWLCFLDADTRPAPDLLSAAISTALLRKLDVLSLHPQQQMLGFWERLLMPIPFMTLMLVMDAGAINDPQRKQAMANGQFILVRRVAYFAVGGHEAIRSEVLDDVRLAQLLKGAGYRLQLLDGGDLIRTRMYSELRTLWQGLARAGSELFGIPLTLLAVLTSIAAGVFPFLYPVWLGFKLNGGFQDLPSLVLSCLGSTLWYSAHALELRRHRVPFTYMALIPLSMLLIAVVNLEGVVRRVVGRRIWKERRI